MPDKEPIHVLFLCQHNSARSILAEALLNHMGGGRFKAHSAGSRPRADGVPDAFAFKVLDGAGISTKGLYSKNWSVFGKEDSPHMDLVITLCDVAAGEECPYWPGHPATAHWSYADPAIAAGGHDEVLEAFRKTLYAIRQRLDLLLNLPEEHLGHLMLQQAARDMSAGTPA